MKKIGKYSLFLIPLILPAFFYFISETTVSEVTSKRKNLDANSFVYHTCQYCNFQFGSGTLENKDAVSGMPTCSEIVSYETTMNHEPRLKRYEGISCWDGSSSDTVMVYNPSVVCEERIHYDILNNACDPVTVNSCSKIPESIRSHYTVCSNITITSNKSGGNNVNSTDGGSYSFTLDLVGIIVDDVNVKIYGSSNTDVTNKFDISATSDGFNIVINKNTSVGVYTVEFSYEDVSTTDTFEIVEKTIDLVYVSSITLSGDSKVEVGKTITISATVLPSDADNKSLVWTSSNADIATVDQKGNVKGISAGSVTITATSSDGSNVKAEKVVTVANTTTSSTTTTTTTTTTTKKTTSSTTTTTTTTTTTKPTTSSTTTTTTKKTTSSTTTTKPTTSSTTTTKPTTSSTTTKTTTSTTRNKTTTTTTKSSSDDQNINKPGTTTKNNTNLNGDSENNPDTGIKDVTIVLSIVAVVSLIAILYIKKYNLFKKF